MTKMRKNCFIYWTFLCGNNSTNESFQWTCKVLNHQIKCFFIVYRCCLMLQYDLQFRDGDSCSRVFIQHPVNELRQFAAYQRPVEKHLVNRVLRFIVILDETVEDKSTHHRLFDKFKNSNTCSNSKEPRCMLLLKSSKLTAEH